MASVAPALGVTNDSGITKYIWSLGDGDTGEPVSTALITLVVKK